jgi:1-acyl-sn-glycerol-3-phosphate acyltransferase
MLSSMSRSREPVASLMLYHAFKWSVVSPVLHGYLRGRIYGAENVPQEGPLVVVSNHASDFDPPIVSCSMRRPVAFHGKGRIVSYPRIEARH